MMIKIQLMSEDEKLNKKVVDLLKAADYEVVIDNTHPVDGATDLILLDTRANSAAAWVAEIKDMDDLGELPLLGLVSVVGLADTLVELLDDLVLLPLRDEELVYRIQRLLGGPEKEAGNNLIRADGLIIDLDSYEVTVEGQLVQLTFKEFELLKFLAASPGRVFNRKALLNQIWEYDYYGGSRTVDVHVRRLRAKLGSKYGSMIQTVRHVGYRFSAGS